MCNRIGKGYSKEFFNRTRVYTYLAALHSKMKTEVEQISDAEIISCELEEWATYLTKKYFVVPISVFETNIEKKIFETKVKKANPFL